MSHHSLGGIAGMAGAHLCFRCRPSILLGRTSCWSGGRIDAKLRVVNEGEATILAPKAEILLEVETGVLVTWRASLTTLPAGTTVDDAIVETVPGGLTLPSNLAAGRGMMTVRLFDEDGRTLGSATAELEVVEELCSKAGC